MSLPDLFSRFAPAAILRHFDCGDSDFCPDIFAFCRDFANSFLYLCGEIVSKVNKTTMKKNVSFTPLILAAVLLTGCLAASCRQKKSEQTVNGQAYVDLGLSVKWASCNVGADKPSEFGNRYAWGETSVKERYTVRNCRTWERNINDIAGNPVHDAARASWGGSWRMPTRAELQELIDSCQWYWVLQDKQRGYLVKSRRNGNSIFLPATGWHSNDSAACYTRQYGDYWSSTPYEGSAQGAYSLDFDGKGNREVSWLDRSMGRSIRPVSE